ncbi:hypothetical protein ACFSO0_17175 [Brevibacillus sp. GCM10020057]|uniref:hypothetical protein n=1 Tax=Brevibacillus sp. GCM10020057 TaxID=3317327 RepID=UPI00363EDEE2
MKIFWIVLGAIFLLCGCGSTPTEKEVSAILMKFNEAKFELTQEEFSIPDKQTLYPLLNDKVKTLLTEKDYQNFVKNREAFITIEEAKLNRYIQVKEIKISRIASLDDNKSLHVDYLMIISISGNGANTDYHVNGQVTLVKENESWKIDRNWDSLTAKELGL